MPVVQTKKVVKTTGVVPSVWCTYVCEWTPEGIKIIESGLLEKIPALKSTLDGIEFSSDGKDARLWLMRGRCANELCARIGNRLIPTEQNLLPGWDIVDGVYLLNNYSLGLRRDDGFEITDIVTIPVQGARPATVLRPPTITDSATA